MSGIADTGFVVAYLNRRDRYHEWAMGLAREVQTPLLTCQAVLAEAAFHVADVAAVLDLVEDGLLLDGFDFGRHRLRVGELAKRYRDRQPDFADMCLICLSEEHPRLPVLTVDQDFRIYRRRQRESIPVLMPPEAAS